MGTALQFSEKIADLAGSPGVANVTVAGKGGIDADIIAVLPNGKTIAREVSVFRGSGSIYSKLIDEADQIGRGMSNSEVANIEVRDVFIQLSKELADDVSKHDGFKQSAINAVELYATNFGEKLRISVVGPNGLAIFKVIE